MRASSHTRVSIMSSPNVIGFAVSFTRTAAPKIIRDRSTSGDLSLARLMNLERSHRRTFLLSKLESSCPILPRNRRERLYACRFSIVIARFNNLNNTLPRGSGNRSMAALVPRLDARYMGHRHGNLYLCCRDERLSRFESLGRSGILRLGQVQDRQYERSRPSLKR